MIITTKRGDILSNDERRIAFPINTEGVLNDTFAGISVQSIVLGMARIWRI